jgi:hypothetical protein
VTFEFSLINYYIMKKIIGYLAFLFLISTASADTKTTAIELEVAKLVRTPAYVEKVLDSYGLVGMPRQVFREHFQEVYKSNEVISMLVKEMLNAGFEKWDKDKGSDYAKNFGAELFLNYAMKGMPRLTFEEQKAFIKFLLNWMQIASDDDCKKLLVTGGKTSTIDDANLEMKYYFRMEKEELRRYFSILRKSLIAEITDYPHAKNLNQQQAKIADDAFENEILKRVENGLIDEKTLNAMTDMSSASPKLACAAGRQIFSTILSMKGLGGELFLTKFVNSLQ